LVISINRRDTMKIEFGAGGRSKTGFMASDVQDLPGVHFVCACWEIDNFVDNNSVDEIYSRHMFEHLTFAQGEKTLRVWKDILRPGGKVHMILPDLKFHVDEYLSFYNDRKRTDHNSYSFFHAVKSIFGGQRESFDSQYFTTFNTDWDIHKSGYDDKSLKELTDSVGYVGFNRGNNRPHHLDVTFYKE